MTIVGRIDRTVTVIMPEDTARTLLHALEDTRHAPPAAHVLRPLQAKLRRALGDRHDGSQAPTPTPPDGPRAALGHTLVHEIIDEPQRPEKRGTRAPDGSWRWDNGDRPAHQRPQYLPPLGESLSGR